MRFHHLKDGTTLALVHAKDVGDRPRYWTCSALPPAFDNKRALHTYPNSAEHTRAWVEVAYADAASAGAVPKRGSIYLIGSLRNPRVPAIAKDLREAGFDVFDDWYSPGPDTDERWQQYERLRGRTFREALEGHHARHAFELDKKHLERCDLAVLVAPAGKSGHLELGWILGKGKPGYILMDGEPERFDLMYKFATGIFMSVDEMLEGLK